ncbi:MAG: hypothetical protein A3J63_05030 [Candidatus Moranbacteria bacterium RIFCSPHIGHO2_02_FULL_40_12b]|nr:MAG: hypothetical protein A3J63_05030 [Candidatus Moranbacteria bacterium RIFCSPHIGHO2_02_FULL_40_12b]OGI23102.1 MAG: hypothetical protein A3E91_03655 [Candidatus Moranbacteria bacterium RIFCSPHIGHO2_12_FULL_40_10]
MFISYNNGVHDFLLAKQIVGDVLKVSNKKGLKNIKSVSLEIGSVSLTHDSFNEHAEDINLENLKFGIESIAKNTVLKDTKFNIKKTEGDSWKITGIEVE